jgi:hypothetical protein
MSASFEELAMTDRERLERQIREALVAETGAAALSEKLFSPTGLFSALAPTEPERQVVVRSELFKQAQARFRELQHAEAAAFTRAVEQAEGALPKDGHWVKWEHAEAS